MRMWPVLGRSKVPIKCSRVDLPDPEGPTMPTNSPSVTVNETSRRAVTGGSDRVDLGDVVDFEDRQRAVTVEIRRVHRRPVAAFRVLIEIGHSFGTTTRWPAASPGPLTCTSPSASSKRPKVTGVEAVYAVGAYDFHRVATARLGQEGVDGYDQHIA